MNIASTGPRPAHVIVFGNEKGGSGKTTMAVNVIVALDEGWPPRRLDRHRQPPAIAHPLHREPRPLGAASPASQLECPTHYSVRLGEGEVVSEVEEREFAAFAEIIERLGTQFDFVVVDTPGNDSYRMRLSHAMADTVVTPVNDSFVDLDVLGRIDEAGERFVAASHYAELVGEARRSRVAAGQGATDWVVVRNRIAPLASRNQRRVTEGLRVLSEALGFRVADGVSERVIFREFFPTGMTAFDVLDPAVLGVRPTMSHLAARREIRDLIEALGVVRRSAASAPSGRSRGTQRIAAALASAGHFWPAFPLAAGRGCALAAPRPIFGVRRFGGAVGQGQAPARKIPG